MLDAEHVLLGWDTEASTTVMAILRVKDGATLATAEVPHAPDQRQQPLVDSEGRAAAFDTLAVTWGEGPMLRPLRSFETSTLDGPPPTGWPGAPTRPAWTWARWIPARCRGRPSPTRTLPRTS